MRVKVGTQGTLDKDLPTTCCPHTVEAGRTILIIEQTSPNRVMIQSDGGSGHKVKASKIWFREGTVSEFDLNEYKRKQEEKYQEALTFMRRRREQSQTSA